MSQDDDNIMVRFPQGIISIKANGSMAKKARQAISSLGELKREWVQEQDNSVGYSEMEAA